MKMRPGAGIAPSATPVHFTQNVIGYAQKCIELLRNIDGPMLLNQRLRNNIGPICSSFAPVCASVLQQVYYSHDFGPHY